MAQWLEHWSCTGATRDRFPVEAREIFQLCFTLLRLSCRKNSETHIFVGLMDISTVKRDTVQINKDFGHKIGKYFLIH